MNNSNEYDTIANTKSPETIKQNLNKPKFGLSGTGPIDTHSYDRTDLQFSNKFKPKPPSSINNNINYNNNRINKSLDFSRSSINNDFNRNTLQTTEKKVSLFIYSIFFFNYFILYYYLIFLIENYTWCFIIY